MIDGDAYEKLRGVMQAHGLVVTKRFDVIDFVSKVCQHIGGIRPMTDEEILYYSKKLGISDMDSEDIEEWKTDLHYEEMEPELDEDYMSEEKKFMYIQIQDGGAEEFFFADSKSLPQLFFGWMDSYCVDYDKELVSFVDSAEIGDVHYHRLGWCVRVLPTAKEIK